MKEIVALARTHVVTALRERITLFWFMIFPVFLLTILSLIFGQDTQGEGLQFDITLIRYPQTALGLPFSASGAIDDTLAGLATSQQDGPTSLFVLHEPAAGQDLDVFLQAELVELRRGNRAAILVLPPNFDARVMEVLGATGGGSIAEAQLYMSQTSVASETAASILEQVFAEMDRGLLSRMGRFDESQAVPTKTVWIGQEKDEARYVDFVLPAVILMGFFTNGLFGVPGTILFNRDRKVLRRYWVTPLSVGRYLAGFGLGHLLLCALQFLLLWSLGRFAFGAKISFAHPDTALILVLAAVTFMAFGFLITALAKTANAGMATANILNMPMMFLSGMFFPVSGLPLFMLLIVYANPVTYLLEALRRSVGVQAGTLVPWPWTILVPLLWIAFCGFVATRRLRWDVSR
jgi:ABC-2 type transport system permease protein